MRSYDGTFASHELHEIFAESGEPSFVEYLLEVVKTPAAIWSTIWLADLILVAKNFEAAEFSAVFGCYDLVEIEERLLFAVLNSIIRGMLLQSSKEVGIVPQLGASYSIAYNLSQVFRYSPLNFRQWLESAFRFCLDTAPSKYPERFLFAIVVMATIDSFSLGDVIPPLPQSTIA